MTRMTMKPMTRMTTLMTKPTPLSYDRPDFPLPMIMAIVISRKRLTLVGVVVVDVVVVVSALSALLLLVAAAVIYTFLQKTVTANQRLVGHYGIKQHQPLFDCFTGQ